MSKVRWILGRTTSRPSSPVYREAETLLDPEVAGEWTPRNVIYLDDDDGDYDSDVGDVLMRPVPRRACKRNTKRD